MNGVNIYADYYKYRDKILYLLTAYLFFKHLKHTKLDKVVLFEPRAESGVLRA